MRAHVDAVLLQRRAHDLQAFHRRLAAALRDHHSQDLDQVRCASRLRCRRASPRRRARRAPARCRPVGQQRTGLRHRRRPSRPGGARCRPHRAGRHAADVRDREDDAVGALRGGGDALQVRVEPRVGRQAQPRTGGPAGPGHEQRRVAGGEAVDAARAGDGAHRRLERGHVELTAQAGHRGCGAVRDLVRRSRRRVVEVDAPVQRRSADREFCARRA